MDLLDSLSLINERGNSLFRDFHPENSLFRKMTVTDIFVCFRPLAWAQNNPPCPMRQTFLLAARDTKPALSPPKIEKIESKPPSQTVVGAVHAHQILMF